MRLFATPWIAAHQASLSITNSRSSLRLMSIESVMPSSHLILCHHLLLLPPIPPSIRVFPMSQLFAWGGQSTGVSALASFLPKKSQGWSLLGRQDRELWTIMETSHKYVPSDIHTFFPLKWQNVHWLLYLQQSKWFLVLKKTKNSFCAKKKKKWNPRADLL